MSIKRFLIDAGRLLTLPRRAVRALRTALLSIESLTLQVSALEARLNEAIAARTLVESENAARLDAAIPLNRSEEVLPLLAEIAAQNAKTVERFDEIDAELSVMRQPDAVLPAQKLIAMLLEHQKPLPDDIHEHALRVQLRERPIDAQLTYSLVALLMKVGRPPVPDPSVMLNADTEWPAGVAVDDCLRTASESARRGDTIGVYATLWRAVVCNPPGLRGLSEYARAFAERAEWANCRVALRRVFEADAVPDAQSVEAALYALGELAARRQTGTLAWKPWVESLPETLRASPSMFVLRMAFGDIESAAALMPAIAADVDNRADASLAASTLAFQRGQFVESYEYLMQALELDLPGTLHRVIRDLSAQVANMNLMQTKYGSTDLADWISKRSFAYEDVNLVPPLPSPESLLTMRRIRQVALERGLPPAFLISQGKSASVSVGNILSGGFGLPTVLHSLFNTNVILPWARDFARGGGIHMTHLAPFPRNVDLLVESGNSNIIVLIRDPRQALVSYLEHARKYRDEILPIERPYFEADNESAIEYLIETRLGDSIKWIDQWNEAGKRLSVNFVTFKEFVQNRDRFVERLLALYGGDMRYFDRSAALSDVGGTDYHRRLGAVDEWREVFNARQTEQANKMIPDYFWKKFDWSP